MPEADLAAIFQSVSSALVENQGTINQADSLNHNHGDDMVDIFNVINGAVQKKKASSASAQLKYAGKQLEKNAKSGTAQVYANGLKQASKKLSGRELSPNSAVDFIQTLLGGQAQSSSPTGGASDLAGNDMLGNLLSGVVGNQTLGSNPAGTSTEGAGNDLLGSLLSGVMGGQSSTQQTNQPESPIAGILSGLMGGTSQTGDGKFDLSDVMQIGMGYMQAKQAGSSDIEALANALLKRTQMGQKEHRAASGQIVAQTLLNAITQFAR